MVVHGLLRAVLAGILGTTLLWCSSGESAGRACSLAFDVSFHGVTYGAPPVSKPFRDTQPLGSGTLPTCGGERPQRVKVSSIRGVDPSIALAAPDFPQLVLLSVPVRQAPAAVASHLRYHDRSRPTTRPRLVD